MRSLWFLAVSALLLLSSLSQAQEEHYTFQAEVSRMLDIVVNSLYKNKDVFLRELISNASDAMDKLRVLAVQDPNTYKTDTQHEIQIEFEENTLTIRDTGIGMTKQELIENLGTVARSGTTKFIEALQQQNAGDDALQQIGQFGVGFYSAFLVADKVTVASKHVTSDEQWVWTSTNGASDFTVRPDARGVTLDGHGTEITLHLSDLEYANADKLKELATHYSEFVMHPIKLRTTQTIEVEDEDIEEEASEEATEEGDLEVSEDDTAEEKPKKMKQVTTYSWDTLNLNSKAIWTREKDSITEEEYQSFYKMLADDDYHNATTYSHFNAEGNINFQSILYLPGEIPVSYRYGNMENVAGAIKLYVRKVLISDDFELMPKYLGFMRGVVDSDDLPLNVNRETLQENKVLKVIRKKLVRKALDLIVHFAKDSAAEVAEAEVEVDDEGTMIEGSEVKKDKYLEWYSKFSPNIKMGVIDDEPNRARLMKLLRFQTSKSDGELIPLQQYLDNMKDWQDDIYVVGGASIEEIEASPFLGAYEEKDVEVLYMLDAVDEYLVQQVRDYEGKKFTQISSESAKFKDEDEDLIKRREKAYSKRFKPLTKWLKKLYGMEFMRVSVSKRSLGSSPAVVSSSEYGNSANMERILRAQAFQHGADPMMMMSMKNLEVNPRHPLIVKLLESVPEDDEDESAKMPADVVDAAWMIHDMALIGGGYPLKDPKAHNRRMLKVLKGQFGLASLALEPEIDPPVEEDEPPEVDMDDMMGSLNMEDFVNLNDE